MTSTTRNLLRASGALALTVATPALAQEASTTPQAAATQPQTAAQKPKHHIVCEQQERIGSRLGGHKVCRDVSDAQNNQSDTRMQVERAQALIQAPRGN